jgi:hypothetical protein
MIYGLRLQDSERDIPSLLTLADVAQALLSTSWVELSSPQLMGSVIFSAGLSEDIAKTLFTRGLDVVYHEARGSSDTLRHLNPIEKPELLTQITRRAAKNLLEAIRPYRFPGDPISELACFVTPTDNQSAQRLLERLLSLRRDDVLISEWLREDRRYLLIQAHHPPLYLLMRAREEASEGVRAYTKYGDSLWVEWGYTYPLPSVAQRYLKERSQSAFVNADGSWWYAPKDWRSQNLYDSLTPTLEAKTQELTPAEGKTKFQIPLRLGAGPDSEPELWLLTSDELFSLEGLLESSPPEALARLTIARTTSQHGTRYVLRELARGGNRFGTQISDTVGKLGFSRATGTDNLYLPVGKRLLPVMRREELKALLHLEQAHAVLIDADTDGPLIISLLRLDEAPISQWIEYLATDRRLELDRLIESAVFTFSDITVEKPLKTKEEEERPERRVLPPAPKPIPRVVVKKEEPTPNEEEEEKATTDQSTAIDEATMLREQVREREKLIIDGGCTNSTIWSELGSLKTRLGEIDEASSCLETALFFSPQPSPQLFQNLAALRARFLGAKGTQEELLNIAVKREAPPSEASYLAAVLLWQLHSKQPISEDILQQTLKHLTEPQFAVSRRVAWMVLSAVMTRSDDKLGLTRAKEKILGGINDRGLHEAYDLPGFVRFALALDGRAALTSPGVNASSSRQEQMSALELLWGKTSQKYIKELDSASAYYRLIFSIGFTRLGAATRTRDLIITVENELPVHDGPNHALFRLYMARLAHVATQGDAPGWQREVESVLNGIREPKLKDAVEWLRKRSRWLKSEAQEEPSPWLRPALERPLAEAEADPERLPSVFVNELGLAELYDYEVTWGIERGLRAALKSGVDALVNDVLSLSIRRFPQITILGHRARAIAACIKAAAVLGDASLVDQLIESIIEIAPKIASVRELLSPIRQALLALRRLGAGDAAQKLLRSLERLTAKGADGPQLNAALADGYLQLKDLARAEALLAQAVQDTLTQQFSYEDRFKAATAILETLPHWPVQSRISHCERFLDQLDRFRDTFTVQKFYPTFKVLLFEHLIDAISDDVTLRSDRLKSYLDAEEQGIRRKILSDWNHAFGR